MRRTDVSVNVPHGATLLFPLRQTKIFIAKFSLRETGSGGGDGRLVVVVLS